jgi:hypothetical protein
MTASEAGPEPRTTSTVARVLLGVLAVSEALIGGWALFAPASFYRSFPAAGHGWVALLPPYNEHLIRDVGSLSLALTVVLAAAAVTGQRLLSAVAVGAFAAYAVPHMIFHSFHLEGFSAGDAVARRWASCSSSWRPVLSPGCSGVTVLRLDDQQPHRRC